ncbi:MAG: branched-chain amino acid ABC transporter permease [Acidobacteriia bacterium]|nr:branched-chain amino acid ABC transporter permease [Terriglobia bacterium]
MTGARLRIFLPPIALLGVLLLLPAFGIQPNAVRLLFVTFVWMTASIAWNLLGGFAGQVSFGFAVFYGVGAYAAAILIDGGRLNPYLALVAAGMTAAIASVLIGLPTFRLRGPYFAIATIGVSETVRVVATNLEFTGGASGYRITEPRPFNQAEHYYTALIVAALAFAVSLFISRHKFGLGLIAINQDEDAAADTGVNPFVYKLKAHAVAAFLTGVAGGVFARYAAFIHPNGVFGFPISVQILLMPVIGGLGTVWGPVIGGVVIGVIEEEIVAYFPQVHLLIYGLLLIVIVLFEPGGILGAIRRLQRWVRRIRDRQAGKRTADARSKKPDEVLWGAGSGPGR